jgi:hypothetical protein
MLAISWRLSCVLNPMLMILFTFSWAPMLTVQIKHCVVRVMAKANLRPTQQPNFGVRIQGEISIYLFFANKEILKACTRHEQERAADTRVAGRRDEHARAVLSRRAIFPPVPGGRG